MITNNSDNSNKYHSLKEHDTTQIFNQTPPQNSLDNCQTNIIDTEILKIHEDESLEKGLKILATNQTLIVAVVTRENHFLGVLEVTLDDSETFYKSKKLHYAHLKEDIFQFRNQYQI